MESKKKDNTVSQRMARMRQRKKEKKIPDVASVNLQIVAGLSSVTRAGKAPADLLESIISAACEKLVDLGYDADESEKAVRSKLIPE